MFNRKNVQGAGCRVALWIFLGGIPSTLPAQTTSDLEREIGRLEQEVALARQEEDSLRAVQEIREMARFIRVQAGGLQLVTLPQLVDRVEAAGKLAWDILKETYEDSVAVALRSFPLSILFKPAEDSLVRHIWYPTGTRVVFVTEDQDARVLAANLLAQIIQELWLRQDPALQAWMKSPPPISTDLSHAFANAYLDLATSASPIAQRCLSDAGECLEALGLARSADPAAEWYSPAGRRGLVVQLGQFFQVGESRQPYDRCISGSDADCLALLRAVPDLIPGTLLPPTRVTFLRVALENGGPGSYPVLLTSSGEPMLARFQLASGGRVEQSVVEWHRRVIAARPHPTSIRQGQAFAAMGWTVLLLGVALRSSRWR